MGFVTLMLATAFTAGVALLAWRLVRTERPALDAAILGFLWIFIVTFDLLVHGLAGVLSRNTLAATSGIGLGAILLIPEARWKLRGSLAEFGTWWTLLRRAWSELPGWLRYLTVLAFAFGSFRFAFLVWALPPFVWDSLTYHLTNVAHWIQNSRIEVFDAPVLRIYSPANYEVFATWFAVFFHHDGWVEASGLPSFGIAGLAVYATARRLRLTRSASWLAALGAWSTPALVLATTGTKNDPMLAAVFLCILAIVVDIAADVAQGVDRPASARALALTLLTLYGLGTKPYLLHLLPGALVAGVVLGGVGPSLTAVTRLPTKLLHEARAQRLPANLTILSLLIAALVLGSYWYARNEVLKGNPFYPYGVSVAGAELEPSEGQTRRMDLPNLWANLRLTAEKFGDKQGRITPDLPGTTGWGWVAYGMGIPALLWAVLRRPDFRALTLGFCLSGLTLLLSSPTSPWNMRYMIWFPALLCLALGALHDAFRRSSHVARSTLALLFTVCMALNFLTTVNYNLVKVADLVSMLERPFPDRQAAFLRVHVPLEYENALIHVPPEAILGYNVHRNGFIYPLFRADFSQRLAYIRIQPEESCSDIARSLKAAGTRYLVGAPEHTDDSILALLHSCGEDGTVLRELGVGLYVLPAGS
jgi:hypothetical protein